MVLLPLILKKEIKQSRKVYAIVICKWYDIICYNHNAVITKQVVSSAFDTLSHCMETYMGQPFETNVSDKINEAIMRNVIKNLRALIANLDDDFARGELMWDRVA